MHQITKLGYTSVWGLLLLACSTDPKFSSTSTSKIIPPMQSNSISYPVTPQKPVVDEYFGTSITDPYRWLEDDKSPETAAWVKAQNAVTFEYLDALPAREHFIQKLTSLYNYQRISLPFQEGQYTYFYKNNGLQNQAVLYRQSKNEQAEVFLDPNTFSEDGTTSLSGLYFSDDGSLLTYLISEGGSDWRTAITINTETHQEVSARLHNIKFSAIAWRKNTGFYYSSYDQPDGSELSSKTDQHKVYFHQLGTKQVEDSKIFGHTQGQKHRYVSAEVTQDGRYLLISAANSTSGNKLYLQDLIDPTANLDVMNDDYQSDSYLVDSDGDTLFIETNYLAPNKRLVKVNVGSANKANWQDVIPESSAVLNTVSGSGFFFAEYMVDALTQIKQFDQTGKHIRDISLPSKGSASGFSGKKSQSELFYRFTNYSTPTSIYSFDPTSGESRLHNRPDIAFEPSDYISKQVFYSSKDGTRIPMIITYKQGTQLNGQNPTILYGYGGFDVSLQPSFSPANAAWLEHGGVYAVANLRGGGEYGKAWHKQGTQLQKQNVFDDFIAGAEYLIEQNFTSKQYLAIRGGSNGGLLVGAVMLQRPELFSVALPAVGVLDMLRYHTFTSGAGWAYDYGTAEQSAKMFNYLLGYSPVHNVKPNVDYPATLITTGDHDDRVVPAHSFKFAATLQALHTGKNPTLIRIETNAGHGAGTPISKTIEQYADIFAFALHNMGKE